MAYLIVDVEYDDDAHMGDCDQWKMRINKQQLDSLDGLKLPATLDDLREYDSDFATTLSIRLDNKLYRMSGNPSVSYIITDKYER